VLSLHHRNRDDVLRWIDRAQRLSALGFVKPSELAEQTVGLAELPDVFSGSAHDAIKTVVDMRA
jgi:hypothetical protein